MLNYCEGSYTNIITSQGAFQRLQFTLTNGFGQTLPPALGRALEQMTCGEKSRTIIKWMMNNRWALSGINSWRTTYWSERAVGAFLRAALAFLKARQLWLSKVISLEAVNSLIQLLSVNNNVIWWSLSYFLSFPLFILRFILLFRSDPSLVICYLKYYDTIGLLYLSWRVLVIHLYTILRKP